MKKFKLKFGNGNSAGISPILFSGCCFFVLLTTFLILWFTNLLYKPIGLESPFNQTSAPGTGTGTGTGSDYGDQTGIPAPGSGTPCGITDGWTGTMAIKEGTDTREFGYLYDTWTGDASTHFGGTGNDVTANIPASKQEIKFTQCSGGGTGGPSDPWWVITGTDPTGAGGGTWDTLTCWGDAGTTCQLQEAKTNQCTTATAQTFQISESTIDGACLLASVADDSNYVANCTDGNVGCLWTGDTAITEMYFTPS